MFAIRLLLLCMVLGSRSQDGAVPAANGVGATLQVDRSPLQGLNARSETDGKEVLVLADGRPIPFSKAYRFRTGTRLLLDYRALPFQGAYQYELSPRDSQPVYTRVAHIVLESLAPGQYQFTVSACGKRSICGPQSASIGIEIDPVFYQAPSFLSLTAMFLVMLAYAGSLWRLRHLRGVAAQNALVRTSERERIARELHDTLLQGVQGLTLHFQAVAQALSIDDPLRAQLENALSSADSIMNDARDQVRDLRSRDGRRVDLLAAFQQAGRELKRDYAGPELTLTSEGQVPALRPEISHEVFSLGKEALRNALHHSHGSVVTLNIKYGRFSMKMMIHDNGVGVDPVVLERGKPGHWGLPGMRERADKICGRLSLSSVKGSGTRVTLRVPAAIAYVDCNALALRLFSTRNAKQFVALARIGGLPVGRS